MFGLLVKSRVFVKLVTFSVDGSGMAWVAAGLLVDKRRLVDTAWWWRPAHCPALAPARTSCSIVRLSSATVSCVGGYTDTNIDIIYGYS